MKLMEFIIQGVSPTGMFINKYNLLNTSLSEVTNASMNIIEAAGYDPGAPTAPVGSSILDTYRGIANNTFAITQLYCRDVYNVNDFAQVVVSGSGWEGNRGGTNEPSFVAAKIKSSRTRQDIKAGFKALPPMIETDVTGATGSLSGAYITLLNTLCTRLGDGLSPFVGITQAFFGWVIVGKEEYTTPSGKRAYRYYQDPVEQAEHLAGPVTWSPVERATTQNSRKFGKGR
jgi:hypothetical protein